MQVFSYNSIYLSHPLKCREVILRRSVIFLESIVRYDPCFTVLKILYCFFRVLALTSSLGAIRRCRKGEALKEMSYGYHQIPARQTHAQNRRVGVQCMHVTYDKRLSDVMHDIILTGRYSSC